MLTAMIIAAALIAAIVWVIAASNRFRTLLVKITEADSGIDVALTKRYDTLTKLIDVVKAYARHESELLSVTIRLRSGMDVTEKAEVSRQMDTAANKIKVIAEGYPELRSSENYIQLQDAILGAEDQLQAARRAYNTKVSTFNQSIVRFPASILANRMRYGAKAFFAAEGKRADVKMVL